jgi:hypothetical protein
MRLAARPVMDPYPGRSACPLRMDDLSGRVCISLRYPPDARLLDDAYRPLAGVAPPRQAAGTIARPPRLSLRFPSHFRHWPCIRRYLQGTSDAYGFVFHETLRNEPYGRDETPGPQPSRCSCGPAALRKPQPKLDDPRRRSPQVAVAACLPERGAEPGLPDPRGRNDSCLYPAGLRRSFLMGGAMSGASPRGSIPESRMNPCP